MPVTSMAVAPLVAGEVTTGVHGFVKFGDRDWAPAELSSLAAIASLFAQLQARVSAEEQLRSFAERDDLTGMHNRRALVAHLTDRLLPGREGPLALLFLDLDRLKAINDYLGHTAGDWLIKVFASRLAARTDETAFVARLGGDEFVVVPGVPTSSDTAVKLGDSLLHGLRDRVDLDGEMLRRTASIGVALGVPGRDCASDLLRRADQALIAAKNAGGNQVALFTDEMSLSSEFRNDIEVHLQGVIERDALTLHYLPEVDMRDGSILAVEALVRWQHPTWGLLSPDAFIGVAHSINLAGELGRWVIRRACTQFAGWRSRGVGQSAVLRLNVSPLQLVVDGFVAGVADILDEFDIDATSLCLEITEGVVVQDFESMRVTLTGLKAVGVQIAIDDFGTGYSVLSHLKSLPVDTIKIDKSFVRELGTNRSDLAIVKAIIALAQAFDLEVVAEGVETEVAARTLLALGCHRAQGFLLSPPLDAAAAEALMVQGQIEVHL